MTPRAWQHIQAEHEHMCAFICGRRATTYALIDPQLPTTADNVVPACAECAGDKADRSVIEWVRARADALVGA
jgi:hypothetical protein